MPNGIQVPAEVTPWCVELEKNKTQVDAQQNLSLQSVTLIFSCTVENLL